MASNVESRFWTTLLKYNIYSIKPITIYTCPLYMPTPFPAFIIIQHLSEWNQSINLRYTWTKHQVEGDTFIIAATGACILMNFISSEVLTDLRERLHYSTIADNTCFSAFVILKVLQSSIALHEFQNSFYKSYKCPRRCNLPAMFDFQTVQTL